MLIDIIWKESPFNKGIWYLEWEDLEVTGSLCYDLDGSIIDCFIHRKD